MPAPSPHPAPPNPAPLIPCATCQYDITSLPETSICPECTTPIRQSQLLFLQQERWEPTSPSHRQGYKLLLIGALLLVLSIIALILFARPFLDKLSTRPLLALALAIAPTLIAIGALMMARRPHWTPRGLFHFDRAMTQFSAAVLLACIAFPLMIILLSTLGIDLTMLFATLLGCSPMLFTPVAITMTLYFAHAWHRQRRLLAAHWYFEQRTHLLTPRDDTPQGPPA